MSVKKSGDKNILSDNVELSTRNFWKTVSTYVKANLKQ